MTREIARLIAPVLLVAALGLGCASNVEKHWGESVASVNEKMIADPEAGKAPDDGVSELEGVTVEGALTRYRKEQVAPAKKNLEKSILSSGVTSGE
jgi:hypothetical protein